MTVMRPQPPRLSKLMSRRVDGRLDVLLSASELRKVKGISSVLELESAGLLIYDQGQRADAFYFIQRGMVATSVHDGQGKRQVLGFLRSGDLFGLAEDGNFVSTARTLTPARIYRMPLEPLEHLLLQDARLQLHFLTKASHDLRVAQRQLIVLGRHSVRRRLASFLLDSLRHDDMFDPSSAELTLPMSRSDMADYLATTPESVSRALAAMERQGLIERDGPKRVHLLDLAELIRQDHG